MSIFIDSANLDHIESVVNLGWVTGVTTNPLLLARADQSPIDTLKAIKALPTMQIFYQLISRSFKEMLAEAYQAQDILEKQLVLKLPPNELGFKLCSQLSSRITCCPTAVYSPSQALLARETGAQYIAVYVNRATRLMGDGLQLVRDISAVLTGSSTELLAASLKSPEAAVSAFTAGAQHLTLPYETLTRMSQHELSREAIDEFREDGAGITDV